jgi:UDP-GlcNAc3NAcA epimerase
MLEKSLYPTLFKKLVNNSSIILAPPASFLEMTWLENQADMLITDSGGVQKEAYFFRKPCIILRDETEWKEIVDAGAAILAGANETNILKAYNAFIQNRPNDFPDIFGDGNASEFICRTLLEQA